MKDFIRVKDVIIAVDDIHTIKLKKESIEYDNFEGRPIQYKVDGALVINQNIEIPFCDNKELNDVFDIITGRLNAYIMPDNN